MIFIDSSRWRSSDSDYPSELLSASNRRLPYRSTFTPALPFLSPISLCVSCVSPRCAIPPSISDFSLDLQDVRLLSSRIPQLKCPQASFILRLSSQDILPGLRLLIHIQHEHGKGSLAKHRRRGFSQVHRTTVFFARLRSSENITVVDSRAWCQSWEMSANRKRKVSISLEIIILKTRVYTDCNRYTRWSLHTKQNESSFL